MSEKVLGNIWLPIGHTALVSLYTSLIESLTQRQTMTMKGKVKYKNKGYHLNPREYERHYPVSRTTPAPVTAPPQGRCWFRQILGLHAAALGTNPSKNIINTTYPAHFM
jgi:hypothetical protein